MNVETTELQTSTKGPTKIKIHYPASNSTIDKEEVGIIAAISASEILESVSVSLNGTQIKHLNLSESHGAKIPIEVVGKLKLGKNRITVSALTKQGRAIEKYLEVKRIEQFVASTKAIGKRWAVVIGISEYKHSDKGITPLKYAHKDAIAFMDFLHSPQGGGFSPANTKLLIDAQATTMNIRAALFTFLKQAGKDDLVLIFYAGHGAPETGRPDNLYLISFDTDPEAMASTAFPMWDMETALERYIVAERVVVLADACHSAGVGPTAGLRSVGGNNLINTYLANLQKTKPGRVTITASEVNELSQEGAEWENHGVFTHFLLKGLKGAADSDENGVVTITEAFTYVNAKVRRATNSQQHPNIQGKFDPNLPLSVTP